jgi:hypothetical protein
MFVEVIGGRHDGTPLKRSWHLLAEGDDGPLIPSMAAQAIIGHALDGRPPSPGARSAARDLELGDYEASFAARSIITGVRDEIEMSSAPLYARVLGMAWSELPTKVRQVHDIQSVALLEGVCTVERGSSLLARFIASRFGFPRAGSGVDLAVRFEVENGIEQWTRTFAGRSFASRQFEGHGRSERLLCEQFGPLRFGLALVLDGGRLNLVLRHWSAFGVPLPLSLGPWSNSFEEVEDERFRFHVEIGHRVTGLIVRYQGSLQPATAVNQQMALPLSEGLRVTSSGTV